MKFFVTIAGEPIFCTNRARIEDLTCTINSAVPPTVGESGEKYNIARNCYSWQSGHECDYSKCLLGKVVKVSYAGKTQTDSLVDDICPQCRSPIVCTYWENGGGNSYVDNFRHQCSNPNCNTVIKEQLNKYAGDKDYEDPWPICPFCGRESIS